MAVTAKQREANKKVVQRYFEEVVNNRNLDAIDELVSANAQNS